jgi:hypothetical protein
LQCMSEIAGRDDTPLGRWFADKLSSGQNASDWIDHLLRAVLPAKDQPRTADAAKARIDSYLSSIATPPTVAVR